MKKRLLDPSFRYTPSYATDIRKTFERIRRLQGESRVPQGDTRVVTLRTGKAASI